MGVGVGKAPQLSISYLEEYLIIQHILMSHVSYFNSSLLQEGGILLTTYDIVRNS